SDLHHRLNDPLHHQQVLRSHSAKSPHKYYLPFGADSRPLSAVHVQPHWIKNQFPQAHQGLRHVLINKCYESLELSDWYFPYCGCVWLDSFRLSVSFQPVSDDNLSALRSIVNEESH